MGREKGETGIYNDAETKVVMNSTVGTGPAYCN